jgi:hypothetical protein
LHKNESGSVTKSGGNEFEDRRKKKHIKERYEAGLQTYCLVNSEEAEG